MPNLLFQSKPFPLDALPRIVETIMTSIRKNSALNLWSCHLNGEGSLEDNTTVTGAVPRPVALHNFDPDFDEEVLSITRISTPLSSEALAKEYVESLKDIITWNKELPDMVCKMSFVEMSVWALNLFITNHKAPDQWRWKWHLYNRLSEDSPDLTERLRIANTIAHAMGAPFGDTSNRFVADGNNMLFEGFDGQRLKCDGGLGFSKNPQETKSLYLDFSAEELPLIVTGVCSLIEQTAISAMVRVESIHEMNRHDSWRKLFVHPDGYYRYRFDGKLRSEVIDFFSGADVPPPIGFVPFGNVSFRGESKIKANLSFDLNEQQAWFYLSFGFWDSPDLHAVSLNDANAFLTATGLSEFVDESCIVFGQPRTSTAK
tara:strand:- start:13347 stop:14465 length:1119 start_codon:yes stop_codon:yes gene_type:complete